MLYLGHCIVWSRDLTTKKMGTEIFGELRSVVIEENRKDKMAKGSECVENPIGLVIS